MLHRTAEAAVIIGRRPGKPTVWEDRGQRMVGRQRREAREFGDDLSGCVFRWHNGRREA